MMFGGGMILIWLIIIAAAYFLIKSLVDSSRNSGTGRGEDPLKILERRYAKGEIDREEYLKRKEDLNH